MAKKRLDDVHRRVVIQMLGSKHAPASVREKHEWGAVRALSSGSDRKLANPIADRLDAGGRGRFSCRSQPLVDTVLHTPAPDNSSGRLGPGDIRRTRCIWST